MPLGSRSDDDQLRRCKKHKKLEAQLMLELPINSAFLDVGAHFGDTTITMAIHARCNGRSDLRFFAFEPDIEKCEWIKTCLFDNGLESKVTVISAAVGDSLKSVKAAEGSKKRARYDGSLVYTEGVEREEADEEEDDYTKMIKLDSMASTILPLGFLHLDVEGWESRALIGAKGILTATNGVCHVLAEVWDEKDCRRRKAEIIDPVSQIEAVMEEHMQFKRQDDVIDQERNLLYSAG